MRLHRLHRSQVLPVSLEEAWRFFASPLNLPLITPPWLNLAAEGEVPDRMFPGMINLYRVKPFLGMPVTWISEVTHIDAPHYFVDEQRFGPYRFWQHQHRFQAVTGGTEMIDTVFYSLKYGLIGTLMHVFLVRRRLEEIFTFRQRALERIF